MRIEYFQRRVLSVAKAIRRSPLTSLYANLASSLTLVFQYFNHSMSHTFNISILTLSLFIPLSLSAQPRLVADSDLINLGEVIYQQPKTVSFTLRNSGTTPLRLTDVNPACGCTKVQWSRDVIAAGATTTVTATFDAALLGTFQKEIEVYSSASGQPIYLTLQGRVVSDLSANDESDLPIDLGTVRLSTNIVDFGDVHVGERLEAQLTVLNNSRTTYRPQLMHLPPYLTARYLPERLAPGRVGRIQLHLNSGRLKRYGLTQTSIYLARRPGDKVTEQNEINVSALLLPDFSHLRAEERARAPRLTLDADTLALSNTGKKKASQTLFIGNEGQRPLVISSVQVRGKSLNISLSDRTIQPGKRAKLKVTFYAERQHPSAALPEVLIIANDPKRPKSVIHIK